MGNGEWGMGNGSAEASVRIVLHAHLRHHNQGQEQLTLPHCPGASIADYLAQLTVPPHEFMGVVLDGELSGDLSRVPAVGSVVELIPAMSGG